MAKREEERHEHRDTGGRNTPEEDLRTAPESRVNAPKITREAEEKKRGGRAKRRRGGKMEHREERAEGGIVHHEHDAHMAHAKHVGEVKGEHARHHAGRKPRKEGGRTGSDAAPFSSARRGVDPPGRKEQNEYDE